MRAVLTAELLDDLYGWLCECAAAGRIFPGNAEIARRYEFASVATAAKAVGRLERQGRIAVLRGWNSREATIVATGACTAPIRRTARAARKPSGGDGSSRVIAMGARIIGAKGRQCQWIEGDPGEDDRCKCLRQTVPGGSWCGAHRERVYLPPETADEPAEGAPRRLPEPVSRRLAI